MHPHYSSHMYAAHAPPQIWADAHCAFFIRSLFLAKRPNLHLLQKEDCGDAIVDGKKSLLHTLIVLPRT